MQAQLWISDLAQCGPEGKFGGSISSQGSGEPMMDIINKK